MAWSGNSPRELGHQEFFRRYLGLARERFDKYYPGQWSLTQRLEALGRSIALREITDDVTLLLFLVDVAVWKEPYELQAKDMIAQVITNNYDGIKSAFSRVWSALDKGSDMEAIDAIGSLRGFGIGGSRKIASAVLRFLDPNKYAVVDYRNWAILSNTGGRYFELKMLEPLAETFEGTRDKPVDTAMYLQYLKVVRTMADQNLLRPADIDMALFAFSDEIKPLSATMFVKDNEVLSQSKDSYEDVKRQKMTEIVMRVVIDNRRVRQSWLQHSVDKLELGLKKCKTPGDIMQMVYNMTTKASPMDIKIRALGRLSLLDVKEELERIYSEPRK